MLDYAILSEIFAKQSPLTPAMFEAAYRSHPKCDVKKLTFTNEFKRAGSSRLRLFVKSGKVIKHKDPLTHKVWYSLAPVKPNENV